MAMLGTPDRASGSVPTGPGDGAVPTVLRGAVQEAGSGLPLGRLALAWVVHLPGAAEAEPLRIGTAETDAEGAFALFADAGAEAARASCLLAHDPEARAELLLLEADGIAARFPLSRGQSDIELRIEGAEPPPAAAWRDLGNWLQSNRQAMTDRLLAELAAPEPDSPVRLWPAVSRAAALGRLLPVLDGSPDDPLAVPPEERPLDFGRLLDGDFVGAAVAFKDSAEIGRRLADSIGDLFGGLRTRSDAVLYRDYLRGIWVTAARAMYRHLGFGFQSVTVDEGTLLRQLYIRFHQDFLTLDDTPVPAERLLAGVLRSALLAPVAQGGFGLAPAALPPRGTLDDAGWLAALVTASGVDRQELRNRYRLRFDRMPGETISPVWLNVEALIGFFTDTWQCRPEPFPPTPAVNDVRPAGFGNPGQPLKEPIVFPRYLGKAPFFLHYQEWKDRQRRFFPETLYDPRHSLPAFPPGTGGEDFLPQVKAMLTPAPVDWDAASGSPFGSKAEVTSAADWVLKLQPVETLLRDAVAEMERQNRDSMAALLSQAEALLVPPPSFAAGRATHDWNGRHIALTRRAKRPVNSPADLAAFEAWFRLPYAWNVWQRTERLFQVVAVLEQHVWWLKYILLPWMRATAAADAGDDPGAIRLLAGITGYRVGAAAATSPPGHVVDIHWQGSLYQDGSLPYTIEQAYDAEGFRERPSPRWDVLPAPPGTPPATATPGYGHLALHAFEHRFFAMAQAEAMLRWADQLYRSDDADSIRRARELYKGVILLHGEDAGIDPDWPRPGLDGPIKGWLGNPFRFELLREFAGNPAIGGQLARARLALFQIERGLNAFGYAPDLVPLLRHRPLKAAADLFADRASAAQADLIAYQTRFEQAQIEGWQAVNLAAKAGAALAISVERREIARNEVTRAEAQVAAVEAQIAAKEAEIAQADSLFEQFKSFLTGMKDSIKGLGDSAKTVMDDDTPAQSLGGKEMAGMLGKVIQGSSAKEAAAATLGSGAALAVGFGIFAYAGYTSMQSLADAANRRQGELAALRNGALPAARAAVRLKQRDVEIARLEGVIAQADLDLATRLQRFQRERFLNAELWRRMAGLARKLLQRYLDMAARAGWLAERALAFEQARDIRVMRMGYYVPALRGLTGPDLLRADLAELEAQRIYGTRLRVPVKHTLSLARDLPLAFGQLKATGRARFSTAEAALRRAYPGSFGHRIRAVTAAAQAAEGPAPRGMLLNGGVSRVGGASAGSGTLLVRFADGLPLSEFRLHADMDVYGLPGETLLQFEGSGFETDWEVVLPPAGAPSGLAPLTDLLLTFDLDAGFAPGAEVPPEAAGDALVMAASAFDRAGLATLRAAAGPARIRFDLARLPRDRSRPVGTIANVALLAIGPEGPDLPAVLRGGGRTANFALQDGIATSNAGPLLAGAPLPLNALVGLPADTALELELNRAGVAEALKRLDDLVLYVERKAA